MPAFPTSTIWIPPRGLRVASDRPSGLNASGRFSVGWAGTRWRASNLGTGGALGSTGLGAGGGGPPEQAESTGPARTRARITLRPRAAPLPVSTIRPKSTAILHRNPAPTNVFPNRLLEGMVGGASNREDLHGSPRHRDPAQG